MIISFILMTLTSDLGVILLGEIRCWSLLGVLGLRHLLGLSLGTRSNEDKVICCTHNINNQEYKLVFNVKRKSVYIKPGVDWWPRIFVSQYHHQAA